MKLGNIQPEQAQPFGIFHPAMPSLTPPSADEKVWSVTEDTWYVSKDGWVVYMQKDMPTDLASTPRIAKFIFNGAGREVAAAVVHDKLYANACERYNIFTGDIRSLTRKECDDIFLDAMCLTGTSWLKRNLYYKAVRMAGWVVWRAYRR